METKLLYTWNNTVLEKGHMQCFLCSVFFLGLAFGKFSHSFIIFQTFTLEWVSYFMTVLFEKPFEDVKIFNVFYFKSILFYSRTQVTGLQKELIDLSLSSN